MKFEQPAKGYRYSIDAFLLAFFASRFHTENVAEFGCGCGIISLLMAAKCPEFKFFELYEIQPELCSFAKRNVAANPMPGRTFVIRCEDVRYAIPSRKPGLIVCNPPFRDPKSGRIASNRQHAVAKNWFFLPPPALFDAYFRMRANEKTGLCLILPAGNFQKWQTAAHSRGLFVTEKILVHSYAGRDASLVLAKFGTCGNRISDQHLILYDKNGKYTEIVREITAVIC